MSEAGGTSSVLVMDGWFLKELAVLRALKRRGFRVLEKYQMLYLFDFGELDYLGPEREELR